MTALQILLQPRCAAADTVFREAFFGDEELHEPVDVGGFPFEVAVGVVGVPDVGLEEEIAGVGEGPVFWDAEFGFRVGLGKVDEGFEGFVFAD